jgi:hypothetical protein
MDDLAEREQKRLAAIRAQLAEARRRARTWQLGRAACPGDADVPEEGGK